VKFQSPPTCTDYGVLGRHQAIEALQGYASYSTGVNTGWKYGMAGAVQHGASTLPAELFDRFPKLGACEIHLATVQRGEFNIQWLADFIRLGPGQQMLRQSLHAFGRTFGVENFRCYFLLLLTRGALPQREQLIVLVNGYLLAPLFLIVPLMVSAVLAADAFAGEKERKTLESLLHLPLADRDLFVAKLLTAYVPALLVSWIGFVCFAIVSNTVAWPVMHRIFIPTKLWGVMIFWVAPAVAALGLSVMVRVSARARTSQEANQLGGAVILPLIFLAVGQATGLLLVDIKIAISIGALIWVIALWLCSRGARRFTRDQLATRL